MDVYETKDYDEAYVLYACKFQYTTDRRYNGVYFIFGDSAGCKQTLNAHKAGELVLSTLDIVNARTQVSKDLKK